MRPILTLALLAACSSPPLRAGRQALIDTTATFMHPGFGAGPVVFTDATGRLVEERRYEPFGVPLDGADVVARDLNVLNKRTDPATGWSDHGARWMAPEIARWTSTDPPVDAPDAKFMAAPWALHPYQYVDQNPIAFWDPNGREKQGPWEVCVPEVPEAATASVPATVSAREEPSQLVDVAEHKVLPTLEIDATALGVVARSQSQANLVQGAKTVGHAANVALSIYHGVKLFSTDDLHEQREHLGALTLGITMIAFPETAPVIAPAQLVFGDDLDYGVGWLLTANVERDREFSRKREAAAVADYWTRKGSDSATEFRERTNGALSTFWNNPVVQADAAARNLKLQEDPPSSYDYPGKYHNDTAGSP